MVEYILNEYSNELKTINDIDNIIKLIDCLDNKENKEKYGQKSYEEII